MNEPSLDLDFKLSPDWMKDSGAKNPYADYEGDAGERGGRGGREGRRDFGARGGFGKKPGGPRPGGPRPGGDRKDGPRRDDRRGDRRGTGGQGGDRRDDRRDDRGPRPEVQAAAVRIEFMPASQVLAGLLKIIKSTHRAYPLFEMARMFMGKPERHSVKITAMEADKPLWQLGEAGPVATEKRVLFWPAFLAKREEFYEEVVTEKDEVKGNFTNVARHAPSGVLLGPTNHHSYQSALRRLHEERFRRVPFEMFKRDIETVNDPAVVEEWKQAARVTKSWRTCEETPVELSSKPEVEAHFRQHYFDGLVRSVTSCVIEGAASRRCPEQSMAVAIRQAWEKQRGFPGDMMHHLRKEIFGAGLVVFKHVKQSQFAAVKMPVPFKGNLNDLNANAAAILRTIDEKHCQSRGELAKYLLTEGASEEEITKQKEALAADLHWLIHAGHVIEFVDGKLALAKKEVPKPEQAKAPKHEVKAVLVPEATEVPPVTNAVDAPEVAEVAEVQGESEVPLVEQQQDQDKE